MLYYLREKLNFMHSKKYNISFVSFNVVMLLTADVIFNIIIIPTIFNKATVDFFFLVFYILVFILSLIFTVVV